jgi:xylan 1,4-beta-xylosidase
VIWADKIEGPWSDPIDLKLREHIDPGHVVGEDGVRWLFLSGGDRIRWRPTACRPSAQVEHVYDPWRYPDDWDVEGFSPEGPKVMNRHGDYFYLITAVGGTAGPPTGHMVIAARARNRSRPVGAMPAQPAGAHHRNSEKWWSRGHATLVEGPAGAGGRSITATRTAIGRSAARPCSIRSNGPPDGWFRMKGGDLSQPDPKPKGGKAAARTARRCRTISAPLQARQQWNFFKPGPDEPDRISASRAASDLKGAARRRAIRAADLRRRRPGLSVRMRDRDRPGTRGPDAVL